jgi:hypothetical protein
VDPATLKMGEVTLLPKRDREAFGAQRAELDRLLDRIEIAGAGKPETEAEADAGETEDENLDVFEEAEKP